MHTAIVIKFHILIIERVHVCEQLLVLHFDIDGIKGYVSASD